MVKTDEIKCLLFSNHINLCYGSPDMLAKLLWEIAEIQGYDCNNQ